MNAPVVSAAAVRESIGRVQAPHPISRHPNLQQLRGGAEDFLNALQLTGKFLREGEIPTAFGEDGLQIEAPDEWRALLPTMRERIVWLNSPIVRGYERAVQRHFPSLGAKLMEARVEVRECYRHLLAYVGHMLGTNDAERLGIDLSVPMPDPPPRGPSVTLDL